MLRARRRIDWPVIVGPDAATPVWTRAPARSESVALLRELAPLFRARHPDDLAKRAVELALGPVGLVRAGVYFYDDRLDLMLGTWGTDLRRQVVDEHSAMFRLDEGGRRAAALATSEHLGNLERLELTDWRVSAAEQKLLKSKFGKKLVIS